MEELGRIHQLIVDFSGYKIIFNLEPIVAAWIIFIFLIIFGFFAAKNRNRIPGPLQVIGEMVVKQLYSLTEDALDKEMAKTYAPLITALFLFLLMANWIGMIPVPFTEEPTKDLNTTLSMGIMGFVIAHFAGIRKKGFKEYFSAYCEPIFLWIPLNVIGELAKIVSISFRLFGNIMGGSIIILVVSHLTFSFFLPPFLNLFFVLFVGAIQAFVFTMLTVVYISLQVK